MSYNRLEFLETLTSVVDGLNIPRKAVTISHGGASLMLGLRDTTEDIDVQLAQGTFDVLATKHEVKKLSALGWNGEQSVIEVGGVDFHRSSAGAFMYPFNWRDAVNGFDVTPQLQLLVDRIKLGRVKDLSDMYKLRSIWIHLPDSFKDRLTYILDKAGAIRADT